MGVGDAHGTARRASCAAGPVPVGPAPVPATRPAHTDRAATSPASARRIAS